MVVSWLTSQFRTGRSSRKLAMRLDGKREPDYHVERVDAAAAWRRHAPQSLARPRAGARPPPTEPPTGSAIGSPARRPRVARAGCIARHSAVAGSLRSAWQGPGAGAVPPAGGDGTLSRAALTAPQSLARPRAGARPPPTEPPTGSAIGSPARRPRGLHREAQRRCRVPPERLAGTGGRGSSPQPGVMGPYRARVPGREKGRISQGLRENRAVRFPDRR
jgi:hypothetical protein